MTTSPLKAEDSRADFEAEFRKQYSFDKHLDLLLEMYNHGTDEEPDIDYYSLAARDAWKWWQASRAAIALDIDWPEANDDTWKEGVEGAYAMGHEDGKDKVVIAVRQAIRAAGITVKGE